MVQASYVSEEEYEQYQKRKKILYIIGGICVIVLIVIVGILTFITTQSQRNAIIQAAAAKVHLPPDVVIHFIPSIGGGKY
jgi:hypothetical protein